MTSSAAVKPVTYGPVDVSGDEIALFGTGINHPHDGEGPAHPMFIARTVIPGSGKVLFSPKVGVDIQRIVHAGIELAFHEPVSAGDRLTTIATLQDVETKETGTLVSIGVDVHSDDGLVVDGVTRYYARGSEKADKKQPPEPLDGPGLRELVVPTRDDQSLLYAEGSGDKFPIHTNDAFAKSVGLPGVIMHGMCTLALCVDAVVDGAAGSVAGVSCRFAAILLPGATISVRAVDGGDHIAFEARRDDGKLVISEGRVHLR